MDIKFCCSFPNAPATQVIEVVCCRMTDLQRQVYEHFTSSEAARRMLRAAEGEATRKKAPRVRLPVLHCSIS